MEHVTSHAHWYRVGLALAVITSMAVIEAVAARSGTAPAGASTLVACPASRIRVTAGATVMDTTYSYTTPTGVVTAFANEAVPVYFYNKGALCHLLMGAPEIRMVRGTTAAAAITRSDLSTPVGADSEDRVAVGSHQQVEALLVVVKPVGPSFAGCHPAASTGILVGGYGKPIASTRFIARRLRYACFDSGVGRVVANYGVDWVVSR